MKGHLFYAMVCLLLAVLTLVAPYVQVFIDTDITRHISGYDINFAWAQLALYLIILLITGIKQNIATALIGLILCFSFFLYFIILSITIQKEQIEDWNFDNGFYYAVSIAVLFWLLHVVNLFALISRKKVAIDTTKNVLKSS
ncbi:MAG: hypothetical protein P8H56_06915 [Crocinitomicaceae bacterium]|nr:hypothetical protein [Crocinitomicaceae bacterium]MDG1658295.1 hypothetical protein [Crocinitomicaceae bacterium]